MQKEELERLRHSLSHIMALAVKEIWPQAKLGIGPAIDNGFYYDFDLSDVDSRKDGFIPEDLKKIEKKMKEIVKKDMKFKKINLSIDEAIEKEKERGEIYKVELLNEIKNEGEKEVSYYQLGSLQDLCRGPHLESSGEVDLKSFKLDKLAGAYWQGDEKNKMLARIYGFAFNNKKDLDYHLEMLEEAKLRDHRKIAKEMDFFSVSDKVGPGLILWHPKLSKIREVLETWWRKIHRENEYDYIYTPHLGKSVLWQESGHLDYFKDSMYPPLIDKESKDEYYVKPMSCPFHVEIYKSKKRSYRDLPLRWNELGTCYRYEKSGEIHGLARPRGFTQDDAHIICTRDQFKDEYRKVVEMTMEVLAVFGFTDLKYYLALRGSDEKEKYVGDSDVWDEAEKVIKEILDEKKIDYEIEEGGAKFYGPSLDIKIMDAIGREWQCPTIQLDMNLPSKFGMTYIGPSGKEEVPIMVHRTIFGSLERFCTILIEHYAGDFPLWLAPTQIKILSLSESQIEYCHKIKKEFLLNDLRAEVDDSNETINNKIRKASQEKVAYTLVIGDKEIDSGTLSVREKGVKELKKIDKDDFIQEVKRKIKNFQ